MSAGPVPRPRVAVVTVAHGRHQHLQRLQRSLSAGTTVPDHWVLVAMSDPALVEWRTVFGLEPHTVDLRVDASALPLAAARNRGAEEALALGAEVLVFLDADCLVDPGLVAAYADVVHRHPGTVWSGPVTYLAAGLSEQQLAEPWLRDAPHPARPAPRRGDLVRGAAPELFWSLSFALSATLWRRIGGFCERYVGYGGEDTDFAFKAVSRQVDLGWVGDARAYHQHHPTTDPPVQHTADILRNARLFHDRWGRWPMLGWLRGLQERGLVVWTGEEWTRPDAWPG